RRLLYVAMTGAIDRLIICGAEGERGRPEGCWWNLVFAALKPPVSIEEPADAGEGMVWRYPKGPVAAEKFFITSPVAIPADGRPSWLEHEARPEPPPIRVLSPAAAYDGTGRGRGWASGGGGGASGGGVDGEKAWAGGMLVHRLLQSLPDILQAPRAEAARRYLARSPAGFSPEERERMVDEVRRLLDDPRFAPLFLPGSRAEVPIVGRLKGGTLTVSGQIDRLA